MSSWSQIIQVILDSMIFLVSSFLLVSLLIVSNGNPLLYFEFFILIFGQLNYVKSFLGNLGFCVHMEVGFHPFLPSEILALQKV